jgi:hypothetical protein
MIASGLAPQVLKRFLERKSEHKTQNLSQRVSRQFSDADLVAVVTQLPFQGLPFKAVRARTRGLSRGFISNERTFYRFTTPSLNNPSLPSTSWMNWLIQSERHTTAETEIVTSICRIQYRNIRKNRDTFVAPRFPIHKKMQCA